MSPVDKAGLEAFFASCVFTFPLLTLVFLALRVTYYQKKYQKLLNSRIPIKMKVEEYMAYRHIIRGRKCTGEVILCTFLSTATHFVFYILLDLPFR